ncbi:MAG: choice-of-anchor U domain-containing protein [Caldilineaceae bacterium]
MTATPESDGDGVPGAVESAVPSLGGSGFGDGNGDGIPDAMQANVASFTSAVGDGYFTLAVADNLTLAQVASSEPVSLPVDVTLPRDRSASRCRTCHRAALSARRSICTVTRRSTATGNSARPPVGTTSPTTAARAVIGAHAITLVFVDGGRGDADGLANGVIVDPGAGATRLFVVATVDSAVGIRHSISTILPSRADV